MTSKQTMPVPQDDEPTLLALPPIPLDLPPQTLDEAMRRMREHYDSISFR